jgi:hypothetical protein
MPPIGRNGTGFLDENPEERVTRWKTVGVDITLERANLRKNAKQYFPSGIPPLSCVIISRNETAAREFIMQSGLVTVPDMCVECGYPLKKRTDDMLKPKWYVWRCRHKQFHECGKERSYSMLTGSIFGRVHIPVHKFFALAYKWLNCTVQTTVEKELGLQWETVSYWMKYLRQSVELVYLHDNSVGEGEKVGGAGMIVEIDESKFGKRKYHRGHRVEGNWVFGGIEKLKDPITGKNYAGKVFAMVVADRSAKTLLTAIKKHIRPGTHIMSDMWKGYNQIPNLNGFDYTHSVVNHSKEFKARDGTCTNTIESAWRIMKKDVPNQLYHNAEKLQEMLIVYGWRRNNQFRLWEALMDVLKRVRYDQDTDEYMLTEIYNEAALSATELWSSVEEKVHPNENHFWI